MAGSDKRAGALAVLGVFWEVDTLRCADCGATVEPIRASSAKVFLLAQVLGLERERCALFIDPAFPASASDQLIDAGVTPDAATTLIAAACRLGLLDGTVGSLRLGAPRCTDCYLRRAETYEHTGPHLPWSGGATPRSRLDG